VRALCTLARILWLQGFPDQAIFTAERAVEDAPSSIDHEISLCYALAQAAAPVALFMGDLERAERFVAMLLDHSARHALAVWHARGRCFEGVLLIVRGDVVSGLPLLRSAVDELRDKRSALYYMTFLAALAEGLGSARHVVDGLAVVDEALAYSEGIEERWCVAELLRIKGTLLLLEGGPMASAEDHFRQALAWGRRQGALSWELRAAISLAGLWRDQGRTEEAYDLLAPIYDRFTEGFETVDLKAARSLIDDLRYSTAAG
jgi:predicted ATPase